MDGFDTLIYEKKDEVAHVTLNRPEALNSYNVQMRDDLFEVLGAIRHDTGIHAVVFKGAGEKAFCAGADLSEFLTAPSPVIARGVRWERDVWGLFQSIPQPLIAALHGYILGSGIEISLCCDIRIASADAKFGLPETALGIIPAAGGTQTLPRTTGLGRASGMMLANRWLSAEEAREAGLVNRVVEKSELFRTVEALARKIAACHPAAVRHAKQAVLRGLDLPLAAGLDLEKKLSAAIKHERQNYSGDIK